MECNQKTKFTEWENNKDIQIFRDYLKIPSVHPNVNYSKWLSFDILIVHAYKNNVFQTNVLSL